MELSSTIALVGGLMTLETIVSYIGLVTITLATKTWSFQII
jgi:hypothetical protein